MKTKLFKFFITILCTTILYSINHKIFAVEATAPPVYISYDEMTGMKNYVLNLNVNSNRNTWYGITDVGVSNIGSDSPYLLISHLELHFNTYLSEEQKHTLSEGTVFYSDDYGNRINFGKISDKGFDVPTKYQSMNEWGYGSIGISFPEKIDFIGWSFSVTVVTQNIQKNHLLSLWHTDYTKNVVDYYQTGIIGYHPASVNIQYKDENGNIIQDDKIIQGMVGAPYTTEQKILPGYTFKEVKGNVSGKFTSDPQTVTYIYTKNPVVGGNVTAQYVDENRNDISAQVVKSGNVGDEYSTEQKDIDGYTFKEVKGNVSGKLTSDPQTVTYIYTKNPVPNKGPEQPLKPDNIKGSTNIPSINSSDSDSELFIAKKSADAVLPKTATEKVEISAIFAVIIAAITGYFFFKIRRNKQ